METNVLCSNYGHVQVRQDEGSPKYLNEYYPEEGHYAGGFGYLSDNQEHLTSFYPGNADTFERIFGIGYFEKMNLSLLTIYSPGGP